MSKSHHGLPASCERCWFRAQSPSKLHCRQGQGRQVPHDHHRGEERGTRGWRLLLLIVMFFYTPKFHITGGIQLRLRPALVLAIDAASGRARSCSPFTMRGIINPVPKPVLVPTCCLDRKLVMRTMALGVHTGGNSANIHTIAERAVLLLRRVALVGFLAHVACCDILKNRVCVCTSLCLQSERLRMQRTLARTFAGDTNVNVKANAGLCQVVSVHSLQFASVHSIAGFCLGKRFRRSDTP
mmetsp:Transcript_4148/g.11545  ORF Transcript_4148/g.11545 Transcript_4148/m.11545 type:complete len:241 (+) Transcript_4148:142-864(+)